MRMPNYRLESDIGKLEEKEGLYKCGLDLEFEEQFCVLEKDQ